MSHLMGPIFVALALAALFVEMFWLPQPVRSTRPVDGLFRPPPPVC